MHLKSTTCTFLLAICLLCASLLCRAEVPAPERPGGLRFDCPAADIRQLESELTAYLQSQAIDPSLYLRESGKRPGQLDFRIRPALEPAHAMDLIHVPQLGLKEAHYPLRGAKGQEVDVLTVSSREILLALMHSARLNVFSGENCSLDALMDEVGLRQSIVAWAERLNWYWPDGGPARWNARFWKRGDLRDRRQLDAAMLDIFVSPEKYAFGCYTATKMVLVQAYLDYYARIRPQPSKHALLLATLWRDDDPLIHIEPEAMWYGSAEDDDPEAGSREGKLMQLLPDVDPQSFIPGDWAYFENTDPETAAKTGYEGSNAIYLGRGKFDDFYNDNNHSYSYREKIDEVYQWRHRVFSRTRDVARIEPLTQADIQRLSAAPHAGGLLQRYRVVPRLIH